jgi:ABC-type nickel/cobalt efflux system permease component RcnA
MPLASLVTGVIAAGYMVHDGEVSLERMAAILTAVAAAWVLFKRVLRRYWRKAHPEAPDSDFLLDR